MEIHGATGSTEADEALRAEGAALTAPVSGPQVWRSSRLGGLFGAVVSALLAMGIIVIGVPLALRVPDAMERAIWLTLAVPIGGVFGWLAFRMYRLATEGLSVEAAPEGLRFTILRRSFLFPWPAVDHAAVERRDSGRVTLPVLAIHFKGNGYALPGSVALLGTEPACLSILTDYVGGPVATVADAINAARDRYAALPPDPSAGYATPLSEPMSTGMWRSRFGAYGCGTVALFFGWMAVTIAMKGAMSPATSAEDAAGAFGAVVMAGGVALACGGTAWHLWRRSKPRG